MFIISVQRATLCMSQEKCFQGRKMFYFPEMCALQWCDNNIGHSMGRVEGVQEHSMDLSRGTREKYFGIGMDEQIVQHSYDSD